MKHRGELVNLLVAPAAVVGKRPRARASTARGADKLTDLAIRRAAPGERPRKLGDGKGLYLLVQPSGAKLWQMAYRHAGAQRVASFGAYPATTLQEARRRRDEAKAWLREGRDPVAQRKADRAKTAEQAAATFGTIAAEFLAKQRAEWSADHHAAMTRRYERDLAPKLADVPIADLTTPRLLEVLQTVEARAPELAHRARIFASQVCRRAVATGRLTVDPAANLAKELSRPPRQSRQTIPLEEFPALFDALARVPSEPITRLALAWILATCCRTGEMRGATWDEIGSVKLDRDDAEAWRVRETAKTWTVPAARMKMRDPWTQPLSPLALAVLNRARELRASDDAGALVFPGFSKAGTLSENALLALLARAGFFGRMTTHGLRASFATWAHQRFAKNTMAVELCLAHRPGGVLGVYHRGQHLAERLAILAAWGDKLAELGAEKLIPAAA